jgi:hypothetical protein
MPSPEEPLIPFDEVIEGRQDPIALYLQSAMKKFEETQGQPDVDRLGTLDPTTGVYRGDYRTVLAGVAKQQGCELTRTFAISDDLVMGPDEKGPFPRLISVVCPEHTKKAAEFFLAASFAVEVEGRDGAKHDEVDLKNLEMFAWDDQAEKEAYQFYETMELEDGTMLFQGNPVRCRQCHLTPSNMEPLAMRMTPIMNELQKPWTHWSVEPDGISLKFRAERAAKSVAFKELFTAQENPGSAPFFEKIIREGQGKVAQARTRLALRSLAVPGAFEQGEVPFEQALEATLGMIRPVFCFEQVQYVSEDGGGFFASAIIDPGFDAAYRKVAGAWPFAWFGLQDFSPRGEGEGPLEQIPVRGNADLVLELRLIGALNILKPIDIIRARALDYRSVNFSDFRCNRWKQVKKLHKDPVFLAELQSELQAKFPADGTAAPKVKDLAPLLYTRMMRVQGENLLISDPKTKEEQKTAEFIAVDMQAPDVAHRIDELLQMLRQNALPSCADKPDEPVCIADMSSLGTLLDRHLARYTDDDGGRKLLTEDRNTRICYLTQKVGTENGDTRFIDPNVESRMFKMCCNIDPKTYIDIHQMIFGTGQQLLTSIDADEMQKKLFEHARGFLNPEKLACAELAFAALRKPGKIKSWEADPMAPGNETRICAARFAPQLVEARPSLPEVADCVRRSEFWGYDSELRSRAARNAFEAMEQAPPSGKSRR